MEAVRFDDLTFTYPQAEAPAISKVSFSLMESEFMVVCGKSGCGKTTLLRHIKKNMIPYGRKEGEILYYETPVEELDDRMSASQIGFVHQNPDSQIVTDKVWHEMAFGLENLGEDNRTIRRKVAEMASFFGIEGWFRKDVSQLSGGQKQLLNLASIMVMQPKLLVLDEPTSQLDPIAAMEFMQTLKRINRDLGTTVIISEHRLEDVFPIADRVAVMDRGKLIGCDTPENIGRILSEKNHPMFYGLPAVTKIYHMGNKCKEPGGDSPLTIREGRLWMDSLVGDSGLKESELESIWNDARGKLEGDRSEGYKKSSDDASGRQAIHVKNLWFRYERDGDQILRDLNLDVRTGEMYALMGGNGSGKTTTMKIIMKLMEPQRGKIDVKGKTGMLPQNPQSLFSEVTVEEELIDAVHETNMSDEEKAGAVTAMLELLEIEHLRNEHPYDISGGEQQRVALGKVLLLEPDILLLDEPTKGLDPFFKITLAGILRRLTEEGKTILMVSHDIEFCAEYADRCGMIFDGMVISQDETRRFFAGNNFYTTVANRMARTYFPEAVTWEEVAECVVKIRQTTEES